jgi:hypothetical protein
MDLHANRLRTARLIRTLKPGTEVHWCPRCGDAFSAGGAHTIARGDPQCTVRMRVGSISDAIKSLEAGTDELGQPWPS